MSDTTTDKPELYMLDEKGRLFRGSDEIGTVTDGKAELKADFQNFRASVTRWLNNRPAGGATDDSPVKKLTEDEQLALDKERLQKDAAKEAEATLRIYQDDVAFAQRTGCPPPPNKHPASGDKTPEFVQWLHDHRPDEWAKRYGYKKDGQVAITKVNADGEIEHVGWRDAKFTTRKTHLSEKIEGHAGLGAGNDWDA